ncbi:acetyltransferase, GNAT family [Marssonina coronariae]|uniref:Acetyltransferase, GNAT family n=1 Tax=Diplocarpon coronariae TaxID=2795749 RepID=A0A218Z0I7_9HELO|nr:acetyltransferase, GNAT family [Marssonina coronariae]
MKFTIRPALPSDIPSIVALDISANKETSALITMQLLSPADLTTFFTTRYSNYLAFPARYQYLVAATPDDKIAGFLVGVAPKREDDATEPMPVLPDDERVKKLLAWFFGESARDKKLYFTENMWLLAKWFTEVDASEGTTFVRASAKGRGLYQRFDWVQQGIWSLDVSAWGRDEPIINYNMVRKAAKEQVSA